MTSPAMWRNQPGHRLGRGVAGPALAALVFAAVFVPAVRAAADPPPASLAIILKVTSDVTQRPDDKADWKPATRGEVLGVGHQIRTGTDGFCAIMFADDRSLLKVSASTEVKLEAEPAAGGKFSKKLWVGVGGVWAQVTKQQGTEFRIETPTSVASVKGTTGYDIVDASGYTTLFGIAGVWNFSLRDGTGSVDVNPGFQAFTDGSAPPSVTTTPPGGAPQWGSQQTVPGLDQGQGGQIRELRVGLQDQDGTHRTLVIRYRDAKSDSATGGNGQK